MKYVTFAITKKNSKNFSLKKTIWYFVMKFSSVTKALNTSTIEVSNVCLPTLQKLA